MRSNRAYRCPKCKGTVTAKDTSDEAIICEGCGFKAPMVHGIPNFLGEGLSNEHRNKGVAELSFSNAGFYDKFVRLKSIMWKDRRIGIDEYVKGRIVLDAGCGPSLRKSHLEYLPDDAAALTAFDSSMPFVLAARKENPGAKFDFAIASITNIPYPDKSFDTTIVSFVLHHVPADPKNVLVELIRVTRDYLIIFDHLKSDHSFLSWIQLAYWDLMDGGCNYLSKSDWLDCLKPVKIVTEIRTGLIFGHVLKLVCLVP